MRREAKYPAGGWRQRQRPDPREKLASTTDHDILLFTLPSLSLSFVSRTIMNKSAYIFRSDSVRRKKKRKWIPIKLIIGVFCCQFLPLSSNTLFQPSKKNSKFQLFLIFNSRFSKEEKINCLLTRVNFA